MHVLFRFVSFRFVFAMQIGMVCLFTREGIKFAYLNFSLREFFFFFRDSLIGWLTVLRYLDQFLSDCILFREEFCFENFFYFV